MNGRLFGGLFGNRQCPACPTCQTCQTCQTCPAPAAAPATTACAVAAPCPGVTANAGVIAIATANAAGNKARNYFFSHLALFAYLHCLVSRLYTPFKFYLDCSQWDKFGACSKVSAAPSGTVMVTFKAHGGTNPTSPATFQTAFMGIIAVCPNTKVTITCSTIPDKWSVRTVREIF